MERWKINLLVLWIGQFFVMAGMTMIVPFLPFYLQELGMTDVNDIAQWTGLIFAANFLSAFVAQPIWGNLADRYGSKIMLLRSGFGMALIMGLMGFASSAWHLLILRFMNGLIAGFNPAATTLISSNTPPEKTGYAMGMLQSGGLAGMILGPLMGGLLAEWIGYRYIFYVTGILMMLAALLVLWLVKEGNPVVATSITEKASFRKSFRVLLTNQRMLVLFSITFLIQFGILFTMPIIPLFVTELHGTGAGLALFTGLVVSITGFSNMITSPMLGRVSDRVGAERILIICLFASALAFIPHFWVTSISQLFIVRFVLGMCIGGLLPMVNSLIARHSPASMKSMAYGVNASALSLGNMLGPIVGGAIYGLFSIREMFLFVATLLLVNAVWTYAQFGRKSGKIRSDDRAV